MSELFEEVDLGDSPGQLTSITGVGVGVSATGGDVPVRVSLLDLGFHDMRAGGDGTHVRLGIVWDRERRVFDFQGDTELCTPAARAFFEEILACSMDWLKDYLK